MTCIRSAWLALWALVLVAVAIGCRAPSWSWLRIFDGQNSDGQFNNPWSSPPVGEHGQPGQYRRVPASE